MENEDTTALETLFDTLFDLFFIGIFEIPHKTREIESRYAMRLTLAVAIFVTLISISFTYLIAIITTQPSIEYWQLVIILLAILSGFYFLVGIIPEWLTGYREKEQNELYAEILRKAKEISKKCESTDNSDSIKVV